MLKKLLSNTIFKLLMSVILGLVLGMIVNEPLIEVVMIIKMISGQIIFFMVPLIILGFVAPSITRLKSNTSKMLGFTFVLAYLSSIFASFFAAAVGFTVIPMMSITSEVGGLQELPPMLFNLDIPPVMSVMSALVLAIMLGISTLWTKSTVMENLLESFHSMVRQLVNRILIPVLPFFIASNFCVLGYEGAITEQLPIFAYVILIVIVCQFIWLTFLYVAAALYSGKNSWNVVKYYAPAYFTAMGTMSSAATLGVALECAKKNKILKDDVTDFAVPLFSNIHLCGSILTEVFFILTVSQVLYGSLPDFTTMIVFIVLLGFFAIGAPGVPGGTVMASLGLVVSLLGFDESGTALLLAIFALQDGFGTACNVTGDGALTLMVNTYSEKSQQKEK